MAEQQPLPDMPALPFPLVEASGSLDGHASYYGGKFHGRRTASGERYNKLALTAASNRFPLNARLAVRREDTNRCIVVRNTDRMHPRHRSRIIDLSVAAASTLEMLRAGVVRVQVAMLPDHAAANDESACLAAFVVAPESCADCGRPQEFEEIETPLFSDP